MTVLWLWGGMPRVQHATSSFRTKVHLARAASTADRRHPRSSTTTVARRATAEVRPRELHALPRKVYLEALAEHGEARKLGGTARSCCAWPCERIQAAVAAARLHAVVLASFTANTAVGLKGEAALMTAPGAAVVVSTFSGRCTSVAW